jgi:hypothetical protein
VIIIYFPYFFVIEYIYLIMISEIKLKSPLLLFFTLLIVLIIATTVKQWGLVSEGFISYLNSTGNFSLQKVNAYDNVNNIYKLYDDIFYDNRNGNVVIVTASPYASGADETDQSVSSIDVIPRKLNPAYSYVKGSDTAILSQRSEESKISTIESLDTAWFVKGVNSKNQLNYITWGNDTYLYVMDLTNSGVAGNTVAGNTSVEGNTVASSGSYSPSVAAYFNGSMKQSTNTLSETISLKTTFTYTSDGKDKTNIVVDFYDKVKTAYQLVSGVWFDYKNGNLLIHSGLGTDKKLDVYARGSKTPSYTYNAVPQENTTPASQVSFSQSSVAPYFIQDGKGEHTIMYWANGDNTILIVYKNVLESNGTVMARSFSRFTQDGLHTSSGKGTDTTDKGTDTEIKIDGENQDILDAFARWYIYFNTNAVGSGDSSDYLLKTQIVPPVCPACPGCQGVCTDCGGKGGSGTKTTDASSSLAFDKKTVVGATGSAITNTVDTAGNVLNKTVDTAGNVVNKTVDTAANVVGKTFDAAGNLLSSTANRLGLDRVGYQQSYGGPVNTSTSSNASGYPSSGYRNTEYRPGSNQTGVSSLPNSNPNDPYSYNGALQSKGGNFMAVTADFSRFGR